MSEHVHKESPAIHKEAPPIQATPSLGEATAQGTMEPSGLTPAKILQMQKTHGNRVVQGMIQMMQKGSQVAQRVVGDPTVAPTPVPTPVPTGVPASTQSPAPMVAPAQTPAPTTGSTPAPGSGQAPALTGPVPAPQVPIVPTTPLTPQQQRKADLELEGTTRAEIIANKGIQDIGNPIKQSLLKFLTSNDKTAALRLSINTRATELIEAEIEAKPDTTAQEKADAKEAAKKTTTVKDALASTLNNYAEASKNELLTAKNKKTELMDQVKESFNTVAPNLRDTAKAQLAKGEKEAQKKVQANIKQSITELTKTLLENAAVKALDSKSLNAGVNVNGAGTKEIDKRHDMEAGLISGATVDKVYKEDVIEPLEKAVVNKFGVGRRAFRRSKELNKFRQELKDAARTQANTEIDAKVPTLDLTKEKGEKAQKYVAMVAKTKAHALAKVSVDSVMKTQAAAIVGETIIEEGTKTQLKAAGKISAYGIAKSSPTEVEKINAAGLTGAKAEAAKILKEKKVLAIDKARKITKGKNAAEPAPAPGQAAEPTKKEKIKQGITEDVTAAKVAETSIKRAVTADDLSSGLAKVGKLIDISTPNAGDSTSLDVELKIPIAQSGGYFLFGFGGGAEREEKELTVSSELTFGAGFQTFGLDANVRFGIVIEAKGKDSTDAMNLISYGMFRSINNESKDAAAFFWGQGGKSGTPDKKKETARKEAQAWAEMMEEQSMTEGNYVDVGFMVKIAMDANIGVAEFSADLALKELTRYQREKAPAAIPPTTGTPAPTPTTGTPAPTLTTAAPVTAGTAPTTAIVPTPAPTTLPVRPRNVVAERRNVVEASTEIKIKFGKDTIAFGLEGSMTVVKDKVRDMKIELSGSVPSQYGEESGGFTEIAAKIVTASIGGGKNIISIFRNKYTQKPNDPADTEEITKDGKKRAAGALLDAGSDVAFADSHFDSVGASLAEQIKGDSTVNDTMRSWLPKEKAGASAIEQVNKIGLSNSLKLTLSFNKEWDEAGNGKEWEVALEASQVKSMEVDAEIIKVEVEKSKRLGKIGLKSEVDPATGNSSKKLTGGLLGVERKDD